MNEENKSQNTTAESNVKAAAKTGKAVANIAKGAATGGMHGAALEAAKSAKDWIIPIIAALLLPLILLAMLPSVIFGSFFGDGTDTMNAIVDDRVLIQNMVELNNIAARIRNPCRCRCYEAGHHRPHQCPAQRKRRCCAACQRQAHAGGAGTSR